VVTQSCHCRMLELWLPAAPNPQPRGELPFTPWNHRLSAVVIVRLRTRGCHSIFRSDGQDRCPAVEGAQPLMLRATVTSNRPGPAPPCPGRSRASTGPSVSQEIRGTPGSPFRRGLDATSSHSRWVWPANRFQDAGEPDEEGIQNWSRVIGSWTVIGVFSKTERAGITSVDLSLH
jgi:hypothetical protein